MQRQSRTSFFLQIQERERKRNHKRLPMLTTVASIGNMALVSHRRLALLHPRETHPDTFPTLSKSLYQSNS